MLPTPLVLTSPKGLITIRPANANDLHQFGELRLQALRDHPTAFGSSYEEMAENIQEWSKQILQTGLQDGCNVVAEIDQRLVGMTSIRRGSGRKRRHAARIGGVYIRPEWRAMGILDKLLAVCVEWAKNQQIIIVKLAVVTNNTTALNAYLRNGFSIYGTEPKVILHADEYYDQYLMSLDIA